MKSDIVIGILLLISILGNIIAYKYLFRAYDQFNDLRLDPLGDAHYVDHSFQQNHYRIVLIGDSNAYYWKSADENVLNLGISYQTSTQIRLRSASYKGKIRGDKLIIIAGGNDIRSILTNYDRKEYIVSECLKNIQSIAENHSSDFSEIYISTVPPIFKIPMKFRMLYRKEIDECILDLNDKIRRLCKDMETVKLLDSFGILNTRKASEKLTFDGTHLNERAYSYLEDIIGFSQ